MDSELRNALDRLLDATANWTLSASPLAAGEVAAIVEAARKVANPDYEAAWDMYKRGEFGRERCRWVVDAALGITETPND